MANTESQTSRIVGPASLADILGTGQDRHTEKSSGLSHGHSLDSGRARVLAESAAGNIDPRFLGFGTNFTVRRRFV
ncbi:MAG: hypothetical protein COV01_03455 [Candidatus Taylorbacteria bacterium CG10_big_fil_rev_8_21_14_0_10_41_48]|uniref:Uncharacterized protein n=1 Tax=Candidatus Taylorbacteria bacterium CG10_big_fil_rev_8_21_14_0_10_41_48 TaxID=1975024 RepID=A0A2M8LBA8_9BACT|nr:MAG: hypothetical protein COV01_03455 [Candidatus Taylorbacteria bacterium CG10_big_fil_rev_8_21_14_0_10_41_48]